MNQILQEPIKDVIFHYLNVYMYQVHGKEVQNSSLVTFDTLFHVTV